MAYVTAEGVRPEGGGRDVASHDVADERAVGEDVTSADVGSEQVVGEGGAGEDVTSPDVGSQDVRSEDAGIGDVASEDTVVGDATSQDAVTKDVVSEDIASDAGGGSDGDATACAPSSCTNICVPYFVQCCKSDGTCGCALLYPPGSCN